jgi:sensor c-di-GMP phosphodiesterase-like protein
LKIALLVVLAVLLLAVGPPVASAANQASFSKASSSAQSAFTAVQTAGKDGGNITSLLAQLNGALALVQKASSENSSNPAQASTDLQSALTIAQQVQSSAAKVAQQGTSARRFQLFVSLFSAFVIVCVAAGIYIFGDRIYRSLWLRMYRNYAVRKVG